MFNRATSEQYIEKQYQEKALEFLYHTLIGRILLKLFIATRLFSKLNAVFENSTASIGKIEPFIREYHIDMREYPHENYRSFHHFFTRSILPGKRPFSEEITDLIAVADSKLLYYHINSNLELHIKGSTYTVRELLRDEWLAKAYKNGTCLTFRLTVDDYHRYCFMDQGTLAGKKVIKGCLHTVGPISGPRYKVYKENSREYAILKTENFGKVIQMEIGALLVGKIKNRNITAFRRGEEKGFFSHGGSTIVLLFEENTVMMDEDIVMQSRQGIETKIKMGETIGEKIYVQENSYLL